MYITRDFRQAIEPVKTKQNPEKYWSVKYGRWVQEYNYKFFRINILTLFQHKKKIRFSFKQLDTPYKVH